jgi:hypothetical protein
VWRSETGDDLERELGESADREGYMPTSILEPSRSSPARRLTAAGVAIALFAASGVFAWRVLGPEPRGKEPPREEAVGVFDDLPAGWSEAAPPPEVRSGAAMAWTGTQLLMWGGYTGFDEADVVARGLAFDATANTWRALPPSPLAARALPASAWTGSELLVWGGWGGTYGYEFAEGFLDDGAAYDPATRTWRVLPRAPITGRAPFSVWTGRELLVWGTALRVEDRERDGAAYDPEGNTWRTIPDAPIELTDATAVWTGEEMIVFGAALHGGNFPESDTAIGAAYNPVTDSWRRIADSDLSPQASTAAWNGTELIAWDYLNDSAAYDPGGDAWRPLARIPLGESECSPQSSAIAGFVLGDYCGGLTLFDPERDRWVGVASPRGAHTLDFEPVAAGAVFLALAKGYGDMTSRPRMFAYRPDSPDASTPVQPRRFVPEMTVEGNIARVDVTFPDGSEATLTYPAELSLLSRGVQPDVSYIWVNDPPPRFPIVFLHGPEGVETSLVTGTEPEAVYTSTDGSEVGLWPAVETDYTTLREIGWWLVYRTSSWSVLVSVGLQSNAAARSTAAEQLSTALSIVESRTGLPVITATGPVELAEGFGESEGAVLAVGDASPRPDTASLDHTVFLSPDGCSGGPEHEGRGYGSNCLGEGNVFASIYGDEGFVDAVLEGLRVEAFTPAR